MNYSIQNNKLTAKFNALGAELVALNSVDKNYIWNIDTGFWNKTSPILFPIVGRLKNDSYRYQNKNYTLSRHGFARDMHFSVIHQTESSICFSLQSNAVTLVNYPFDFELQIEYVLNNTTLSIRYKVINNNDFDMPFSIGAHPAFALPNAFENYSLCFEKDEVLKNYSLENDLLSDKYETLTLKDKKLPLSYALFEKDALVFKNIVSKNCTIFEGDKPYLKISFEGFPSFGIWTKKNAPFLCLEPWFGFADNLDFDADIFQKEGIVTVKKHEVFSAEYTVEIL